MADCIKDGCPRCGTVAYRVPDEDGTWAFDHMPNGGRVCQEDGDVWVHID